MAENKLNEQQHDPLAFLSAETGAKDQLAENALQEAKIKEKEKIEAENIANDKFAPDFNTYIAVFSELTDNDGFRDSLAKLSTGAVAPFNQDGRRLFGDGSTAEAVVGASLKRLIDESNVTNKDVRVARRIDHPYLKKAIADDILGMAGRSAIDLFEIFRLTDSATDKPQKLIMAKRLMESTPGSPSKLESFKTSYEKSFGQQFKFSNKYQSSIDELSLLIHGTTEKADAATPARAAPEKVDDKHTKSEGVVGTEEKVFFPALIATLRDDGKKLMKDIWNQKLVLGALVLLAWAFGGLDIIGKAALVGLAIRFGYGFLKRVL